MAGIDFGYDSNYISRQLAQIGSLSNMSMPTPRYRVGDIVRYYRSGDMLWKIHQVDVMPGAVRYRIQSERGDRVEATENELLVITDVRTEEVSAPNTNIEKKEKTKAQVAFDTVIIEDGKREQILEALEQVNQADLIFDKWGFGETIEKGKGVSMLFYGPPGTGKTLMAQAIANKLDYTLKVISTADVESSAPGEAERNIRKHFKDASETKKGKSILLFDECDSLIYTRANAGPIMSAQINELLSQIERFDGITLFTTNRLGTLDEALNRRLALKLEFAMPTQEQRALIWQRMFPKQCPLDKDIDWMRLAVVEISGGYIKNAVLRAARMAAAEKTGKRKKKIRMAHLVKALRLEAESMIEFENAREQHIRDGAAHVVRAGGSTELSSGTL